MQIQGQSMLSPELKSLQRGLSAGSGLEGDPKLGDQTLLKGGRISAWLTLALSWSPAALAAPSWCSHNEQVKM